MKKYLIALSLVGLATTSCYEKLNIAPPNRITDDQVQKDPNALQYMAVTLEKDAMTMRGGITVEEADWLTVNLNQSLRGNDIVFASVRQSWKRGVYRMDDYRSESSGSSYVWWYWCGYHRISSCNKLLNMVQDVQPVETELATEKARMDAKAVALTLRAYNYMHLARNFTEDYLLGGVDKKGVPIYKIDNQLTQAPQPRQTTQILWDFILDDLRTALKLFKTAGVTTTKGNTEDVDPAVAQSILAYACMHTGNYGEAIQMADAVLGTFSDLMSKEQYIGDLVAVERPLDGVPDLEGNGFTTITMNPEVIFGFNSVKAPGGISNFNGWMNIYGDNGGYGGSGTGYMTIDKRLYNLIDDADYRKKNFYAPGTSISYRYVKAKSTETLKEYFNIKFATKKANPATPTSDNVSQDFILARASEMLLLKAEAQLKNNEEGAAKETLNKLIKARTNDAKTIDTYGGPAVQALSTLQKIQLQWRIEMWGELGLEYYNNKRWGLGVDRVNNGIDGTASGHVDVQAKQIVEWGKSSVWQIPLQEVNYNPGCAGANQNPY